MSNTATRHHAALNEYLSTAWQRDGLECIDQSSAAQIANLFASVPDNDTSKIRSETANRFMLFLFQSGPHPGEVMRLLYRLSSHLAPELLRGMPREHLDEMLGETRAAHFARIERMFTYRGSDRERKRFPQRPPLTAPGAFSRESCRSP